MNKFWIFIAGAATALLARPYMGPAFRKGVQQTLKSFEEAQRELERQEAAAARAATPVPRPVVTSDDDENLPTS